MMQPLTQCSGPARRRTITSRPGTTLIELLAGLVVLGVLLVSVSIARARFMRLAGDAQARLAAVRAADALMTQWMTGPPQAVPLAGEGPVDGLPRCVWQTRVLRNPAAASLGAVIVRLEIIDTDATRKSKTADAVKVDFLLHDMRQDREEANDATTGHPRLIRGQETPS